MQFDARYTKTKGRFRCCRRCVGRSERCEIQLAVRRALNFQLHTLGVNRAKIGAVAEDVEPIDAERKRRHAQHLGAGTLTHYEIDELECSRERELRRIAAMADEGEVEFAAELPRFDLDR